MRRSMRGRGGGPGAIMITCAMLLSATKKALSINAINATLRNMIGPFTHSEINTYPNYIVLDVFGIEKD